MPAPHPPRTAPNDDEPARPAWREACFECAPRDRGVVGGEVKAVRSDLGKHERSEAAGCSAARCTRLRTFARTARSRSTIRVAIALLLVVLASRAEAAPLPVYGDALASGFADWSWGTHSLAQSAVVHGGSAAISFEPDGWAGLYLHRDAGIDVAAYGALELWVRGAGSGGQKLTVALLSGGSVAGSAALETFVAGGSIPGGSWAKATVPFGSLGVTSGYLDGVWLQDASGVNQATLYVDDVQLLAQTTQPPPPAAVSVAIDPAANRRAVSRLIYGVNFASPSALQRVHYTVQRWGGNSTTRYSWIDDTSNHASDWFFYTVPEDNPAPQNLPNGSTTDRFIDDARAAGAEPLITVPLIGWTPKDRSRRWGFSVAKYGAQQQTECTATGNAFWCTADAGNGLRPDGTPITGNDPHDTSREIGPSFVTDWLAHIAGRTGAASAGGVKLFALDNEPTLWNSTHRDVHPAPPTFDELWQRTVDYASAIKAQDPAAELLGPVPWGWCAYFGSAADDCVDGADRQAHGGMPFLEWYLAQVTAYQQTHGVRLVDYLDVHYYPAAPGVTLSDDESAPTAARRLRTLKSLHDPSYVDESWIGVPVRLIPRMKEWIAARAPGVKLAITEYSWGNDDGPSSALAQAEALAIFGREGVDLATRWVAPEENSRVEDAFLLYLDYDGAGSTVDGTSVRATSDAPDAVGAYAVQRDDGRLHVLLFNHDTSARDATATVAGATDGSAALYRFSSTSRLSAAGTASMTSGALRLTLPPRSATLAVVDAVAVPACEALRPGSINVRKRTGLPAKVVAQATFFTSAALDPLNRGLALQLTAGAATLAAGQLGGAGAPVQFVPSGARAVYADPSGRVAGVTRALLIPGAVQLDGRRKWTVKLKLTSAAASALAAPVVPSVRLRVDGDPPCADTGDAGAVCAWSATGAVLRCSPAPD